MTKIVPGNPSCARIAADLAYESGPEYNRELFGPSFRGVLERMYRKKKGYYSYRHSLLAVHKKNPAGALMYAGHDVIQKEGRYTDLWLYFYLLPRIFRQYGALARSDRQLRTVLPGECYILYLSVRPALRSRGIGRALIRETEKICGQREYTALVLDVNERNVRALRFYKKNGFSPCERFTIRLIKNDFTFIRMKKTLTPASAPRPRPQGKSP